MADFLLATMNQHFFISLSYLNKSYGLHFPLFVILYDRHEVLKLCNLKYGMVSNFHFEVKKNIIILK